MAQTDTLGVGPMGCLALLHLADAQPCSAQDLANRMGRDASQTARLVKHLEAKDVISRAPSATDKRATVLSVTELGAGFVHELKRVMSEVVDEVCGPLPENERAQLTSLLKKI